MFKNQILQLLIIPLQVPLIIIPYGFLVQFHQARLSHTITSILLLKCFLFCFCYTYKKHHYINFQLTSVERKHYNTKDVSLGCSSTSCFFLHHLNSTTVILLSWNFEGKKKDKAYFAMIKLDRVWFVSRDLRLAREKTKNSDFWYKVLPISSSYSLSRPHNRPPHRFTSRNSQPCCVCEHCAWKWQVMTHRSGCSFFGVHVTLMWSI